MARNRKEKDAKIPLKKPDRSGPDPSQETLLQMAEQRGLLNIPQAVGKGKGKGKNKAEPAADEEPLIGRLGESILWTFSLTMLHFSMDVLVARQYAVEIEWDKLIKRSLQAFPGTLPSFYAVVRKILMVLLQSSSSSSTPSIPTPRPQSSSHASEYHASYSNYFSS